MTMTKNYFIGVDVGTGSARAALVDEDGNLVAERSYNTTTYRDEHDADIFEQSTTEIWQSICKATKGCLEDSKVKAEQVKGIGFDATCSLAVSDLSGAPQSVTKDSWGTGSDKRNIILWADHRAHEEAALINSTGSSVLNYVGGTMSLEMEIPKVLWLKKHMPAETFKNSMFFDLPDFLTYLATSDLARSNCSLGCKCSYVPPGVGDSKGWNPEFFTKIGIPEFVQNNFSQLGGIPGENGVVLTAGQPVGTGLSQGAASELGLIQGTPVGSGVIDAYAGWIGTVAAPMPGLPGSKEPSLQESRHRLAAIAGTSTCHVVQSEKSVFVPGVWGPYKNAVFEDFWMNEGGQSSTGQLIDFIIDTHPASEKVKAEAKQRGTNHFVVLSEILDRMMKEENAPFLTALTKDYYLYPDLHGNRSPLADNTMRGILAGIALDRTTGDLALRYLATCEAIALQTRQILDSMNKSGHEIKYIFMSGGLVKNPVLMQLIADICNVPVQLPFSHSASVVLGSAMLGAAAAQNQTAGGALASQADAAKRSHNMREDLWNIMIKMSKPGTTVMPKATDKEKKLLQVKYNVFLECIEIQRKWRGQVKEAMQ